MSSQLLRCESVCEVLRAQCPPVLEPQVPASVLFTSACRKTAALNLLLRELQGLWHHGKEASLLGLLGHKSKQQLLLLLVLGSSVFS